MKRKTRARHTAVFVFVFCLRALVGWFGLLEAQADEWLTFAPESAHPHTSDSPQFFTDGFFGRLLGIGSTATANTTMVEPFTPIAAGNGEWAGGSEFFFDESGYSNNEFDFLPHPSAPNFIETTIRGGWWGVSSQGSPLKVGQYQDLRSSAFWDVDQLVSDGIYTLDLYGTGSDNESTQSGLNFFTPKFSADLRYRRFLHRLDHDPLTNMPSPLSGEEIVSDDLNVGEDYAVRVQDLKTNFKGRISESVKYRVNLWLRRKKGERQALGTHHGARSAVDNQFCQNCHVLTQRQQIDWLTLRVEPVVEARIGPVTAEYSRPMRSFSQNDDVVVRSYGDFHGYNFGGDFPYAVVPETVSQTDRLKLGFQLPAGTRVYSQMHRGDTHNRSRDTRRTFYGFDLRLTNDRSRKLTLNGFARLNRQLNQFPPFFVDPEGAAVAVNTSIVPPYGLRRPIDYSRSSVGADAKWRPLGKSGLARGLAFNIGGEHGLIKRTYAEYVVQDPPAIFDQHHTHYTSYFLGTTMKWHARFDTFLRYKGRVTSDPLYGVNMYSGVTNTNLPEQEDVVQFGGTWVAADNFIASASVGIENRRNSSQIADFVEDNYPMTFTLWYAPNPEWSLSGGYGYYNNWIDQQIYFPSDDPATATLDRRQWNYGGRGEVISFGSSFACTDSITLSGGLEYVWAFDAFDPLTPWPDLPAYSDVIVNMTRYHGGLDWCIGERVSAYARYIFQEYDDGSNDRNSGSAHMFLGGFTGHY